jgi:hypothetical protein
MGRISCITAALVLLTASWVCAGNFEVLANAGVIKPATSLHIKPGLLVKAEYKADMKATSDISLDKDLGTMDQVAAPTLPRVQARPAAALKDRRTGGMAPPPRLTKPQTDPGLDRLAAGRDEETTDLESDLEKDLVIAPPPAKTEDQVEMQTKPIEKKPAVEKKATTKAPEKKAAPTVKKMAPPATSHYAISQKPIQKVKTTQAGGWARPAGAHVNRSCPVGRECVAQLPPAAEVRYQPMTPPYMASGPRNSVAPGYTDRFVRDGVTVKLAPAAAPPQPEVSEDTASSDIISAAVEIIGLPFALISSFF